MRKNILLTGAPRSGKTTVLKRLLTHRSHKVGFVTNEIIEMGERTGFEVETSAGTSALLASIHLKNSPNVGRYGVQIGDFTNLLDSLFRFMPQALLYIDEIAEMQLCSERFAELVRAYLDTPNTCVATCSAIFPNKFINEIRNRNDVILVDLRPETRDSTQTMIEGLISKISKARKYASEPERIKLQPGATQIKGDSSIHNLTRQHDASWACDCDFFSTYRKFAVTP